LCKICSSKVGWTEKFKGHRSRTSIWAGLSPILIESEPPLRSSKIANNRDNHSRFHQDLQIALRRRKATLGGKVFPMRSVNCNPIRTRTQSIPKKSRNAFKSGERW